MDDVKNCNVITLETEVTLSRTTKKVYLKEDIVIKFSNRHSNCMYPLSGQQTDLGADFGMSGGGGDHTRCRSLCSKTCTFLDEPTFSDDPAEWNRADYTYNIHFLKKYMINQQRYLEQEKENFARNKELLASMKSAQQIDNDECIRKKSEIQNLKNEIEDYKSQIRRQSDAISNCRSQLICEDEVNRDLKVQKRRLMKQKVMQLTKQSEEGISDDVIEAYELAKQSLESEQKRKQRLLKKDNWYTTEIATIREVLAQEKNNTSLKEIEIEKVNLDEDENECTSNNNIVHFLPEINRIRACAMSPEPFAKPAENFQGNGTHKQGENACGFLPHLPPVSKARLNLSCQTTVAAVHVPHLSKIEVKDGHNMHLPKIEVKDESLQNSPTAFPPRAYVPHQPTVEATRDHVPHQPTLEASRVYAPHQPTDEAARSHVPHLPTVAATHGYVPHPPTDVSKQTYVQQSSAAPGKQGHVPRVPIVSNQNEDVPHLSADATTALHLKRKMVLSEDFTEN